jgi:hypothetical protein
VYYQLYKRKVGRQRIQEHSIRRTLEKMVAESEVLNNPTGRNKLVFSSEEACLLHIRTNKYWLLHSKSAYTIQSEILPPRLLMQLIGTDCGRDIIHPNIWLNATMEYVPGKSNWVLTDTDFLTKEVEYIKEKVLS